MPAGAELWLLVALCAAATFVWRGGGLLLSQRLAMDGPAMRLLACIAYATLAALIARIMFLPAGILEDTAMWQRLTAAGIALALFMATRMNLFVGVVTGGAALIAIVTIFDT